MMQGGITDPVRQVAVLLQALATHEGLPVLVTAIHHLGTVPEHLLPPPGDDHQPTPRKDHP